MYGALGAIKRVCLVVACLVPEVAAAEVGTSSTSSVAGVRAPVLVSEPAVSYPAEALQRKLEGRVHLELEIDAQGSVTNARALSSPHAVLAQAAERAAKKFRFRPAAENGVPIPVVINFSYRFVLPSSSRTGTASVAAPLEPEAPKEQRSSFTVVVEDKRPARSASDWTFTLGTKDYAQAGAMSGADLLRKAPGVYISQHSGQGKGHQIFLRGFDAVHGQEIALNVGGIPVNEVSNIHAQGYADLHFMIPEVVQTMRVIEGAYDPRQGDFAVAGSIDFHLGLKRRGAMARYSGGRFGLTRLLAAWGPEGEAEETFVATEVVNGDGFGPARAHRRASVIGQALIPVNPTTSLRFMGSSYGGRFDSAGALRLDDFEAGRVGFFDTYDSRQGGVSQRHQALLEVLHEDGDASAGFSTYLVRRDFRLRTNFTGFLGDDRGDLSEQTHQATTFGGRGFWAKSLVPERVRGELGVVFRYDSIDQSQRRLRDVDSVPYSDELDNGISVADLGLYADLNIHLTQALQLRGGLRGEAVSFLIDERLALGGVGEKRDAFGFHLAPKATLDYGVNEDVRVFLSYGNGFRSPQAISLGQGERSPLTVVNSGELGTQIALSSAIRFTATAFVTHVAEDLVFDHVSSRLVFGGPTLRGGGTTFVEYRFTEETQLHLSATYTYAEKTETNTQLAFVPPLVVRLDLDGHHHVGRLFGEPLGFFYFLGATGLGPRPLPFSESGQSVLVLEAALGLEIEHIAFSVEGFNLLDARWRDTEFSYASNFDPRQPGSLVPARHFTAGRPLSVQGTISVYY